jgi:hypothetical protein
VELTSVLTIRTDDSHATPVKITLYNKKIFTRVNIYPKYIVIAIQEVVRLYADYRIKQHASLRLL